MEKQKAQAARDLQESYRELFIDQVERVIKKALFKEVAYIDPYDDEEWMVDIMVGALKESLESSENS